MVMVSNAQITAALAAYEGKPTRVEAMRAAIVAAMSYKEPETEEQKSEREFRKAQQRAADMRAERTQRKLEEDAAAHRRNLQSQGWDM